MAENQNTNEVEQIAAVLLKVRSAIWNDKSITFEDQKELQVLEEALDHLLIGSN